MRDWCDKCANEYDISLCSRCEDGSEYIKRTNADRIRSMRDEELADMFHNNGSYVENGEPKIELWIKENHIILDDSVGCILEWLQSEVEE